MNDKMIDSIWIAIGLCMVAYYAHCFSKYIIGFISAYEHRTHVMHETHLLEKEKWKLSK